jgi:DinB superfamily
MANPKPVEELWSELERARAEVLREVEGLSQRQVDWKPGAQDWSIGEVVDHLTIAEIATGKVTTKLFKTVPAGEVGAFPADLVEFRALPRWPDAPPAGAPEVVWPAAGKPVGELVDVMKATRERSRQSVERLGQCDPRRLTFKHFRLGELDLAQWWRLQAEHDQIHVRQIREIKAAAGFPRD